MQYDVARTAFETEESLVKYPEIDGVTHPGLRKAVGLWSRGAIQRWHKEHPDPHHILISEVPLIGNRLIELARPLADSAEALLQSDQALFLIAVPSSEVRAVIEEARARTIAKPQHEKEALDAPPHVISAMWQDVAMLAKELGVSDHTHSTTYSPRVYGRVFEALLQHRNSQTLLIEENLKPSGSVYELDVVASELRASTSDVERILREIDRTYTPETLAEAVDGWFDFVRTAD